MIDDLLKAQKIPPEIHDLYMLFQANELGRKVLSRMTKETFMDEPSRTEFSNAGFAFYDGRRSVFRDIHRTLDKINQIIEESKNDGNSGNDATS